MKTRKGFVSNSSSTCYIITNKTKEKKTLLDFVKENPHIVEDFCSEYDWEHLTQQDMINSAEERMKDKNTKNHTWRAREEKTIGFGDSDGDVVGRVFDYMLRSGGHSKSFRWKFHEYWR